MKSHEVLRVLRITRPTLTKYVKSGIIKVQQLPNGRYKYSDDDVYAFLNKGGSRKTYIYVSTWRNEDGLDIDEQIARISGFISQKNYEISGMFIDENCTTSLQTRAELLKLLGEIFEGNVERVLVTHVKALSNTEYELLQYIIMQNRCELVIVEE